MYCNYSSQLNPILQLPFVPSSIFVHFARNDHVIRNTATMSPAWSTPMLPLQSRELRLRNFRDVQDAIGQAAVGEFIPPATQCSGARDVQPGLGIQI